ncbi:MAG: CGNR zinc finger domain-containing protein [Gemmatimonadota bacterium]
MGDLVIDFVNAPRHPGDGAGIGRPEELAAWLTEAAPEVIPLLPTDTPGLRALHTEAVALQRAIRAIMREVTEGSPPDEASQWVLDACLSELGRSESLASNPDESQPFAVDVHLFARGPRAPLGVVAREAAQLLGSVAPQRLRQCAAEACERWFVDLSKAGRRKWCSMATCGNRAKASRYRERHSGTE